jgi:acyl-CoA thioesterase
MFDTEEDYGPIRGRRRPRRQFPFILTPEQQQQLEDHEKQEEEEEEQYSRMRKDKEVKEQAERVKMFLDLISDHPLVKEILDIRRSQATKPNAGPGSL